MNIAAQIGLQDGSQVTFSEKWNLFRHLSENMLLMVRHISQEIIYAPLYIHSFQLFMPRTLVEAEKFNITYSDPDKLTTTSDKLRYYRYKKALLQRDVADYAEIDRSTYIHYENGMDYYPPDKLSKITDLLEIDMTDLLDDYNAFINGQGQQIRALRKKMKLTQKDFGECFGVHAGTVKKWENEKVRITKSTYNKLFNESYLPE